jgi:hypothetical protein
MSTSRRHFLRLLRDAAAAAGAGSLIGCETPDPSVEDPTPAAPAPTGSFPIWPEALLPEAQRPRRVMELFLWGGINPFDSLYVIPEFGDPSAGGAHSNEPWMWWAYQDGPDNMSNRMDQCGYGNDKLLLPWATDAAGRTVNLGPFVHPLRNRPDILAKMRLFVMRHDQVPHEGGVPLSLTGVPLGNPRAAATPAHVEAWMQATRPGERRLPWSYVVYPDRPNVNNHNVTAAFSVGLHRPSARPLAIRMPDEMTPAETLPREIARARLQGWTGEVDAAVDYYAQRYVDRLRHAGTRLRSPALDEFLSGRLTMSSAEGLEEMLSSDIFQLFPGSECGQENGVDLSRSSLALGMRLLSDPINPALYTTVVDGGLITTSVDSGYDTHAWHVRDGSRNVIHTMKEAAAIINEPDENDPNKLDLEQDTLLITTEFGRTPFRQGDSGLNHWPHGYVVAAIGGPFDNDRSGVVGAINEDGWATDYTSPSEFRAAILLAMGVWPFSNTGFAVGDVRDVADANEAAAYLREVVLGHPIT